ncbi:MAG: autotransporter outer membrane beta-barrel domain-containing protein [Pseudomonadales bacterium]
MFDVRSITSRSLIRGAHRTSYAALACVLLALSAFPGAARAASIDSAQFCAGAEGFEFDVLVSGTTDFDFIFRISADNQVFQSPSETFGVNFDATGAITRQEPSVSTSGTPPFDRWQDGLIASSSIIPLGNDQYRIAGVISAGSEPFVAGETVSSLGFRTSVDGTSRTATLSAQPIGSCADGTGGQGPDGGGDLVLTGARGETVTRNIWVTGSDFPIFVDSEIGTVTPNQLSEPGPVTYSLTVPADVQIGSVIEDGIFLFDSTERFDEVAVTLTVIEAEEQVPPTDPPPEVIATLALTGSSAAPVTAAFAVEGLFPIEILAEAGSVEPGVLLEAGDVTYTLAIAPELEPGSVIEDTISLTDVDGTTRVIRVSVEVTAVQQELALITLLAPNEESLARLFDDVCPRLEDGDAADEDLLSICNRLKDPANTPEQIAAALLAINPEEILAATTSALRLTRVQHGNLSQRINAVRTGATGRGPNTGGSVDVSGLNLQIAGQTIPGAVLATAVDALLGGGASADDDFIGGSDFGRWGLFVNGSVSFGDQSRGANEAGFDFNSQGITAGIDYRLRDNAFLGAALGFAAVDVDFDNRGGDMDIESWNLSLFGSYFYEDKFYLDGLINYGRSDYDSTRNIRFTDAQGEVNRTARGSTKGTQRSLSLSSGYDFNHRAWTVGPHFGTDLVDSEISTLRETGAGALSMIVGSQSSRSWTINVGGHASYAWNMRWGVLIPHVSADLVRELETSRDTVLVRLAADPFNSDPGNPTPTVVLQSDRPDPNYMVFSAGTSAQFIYGISGFVNYQQMAGMRNFKMTQVNVGLRFERQF